MNLRIVVVAGLLAVGCGGGSRAGGGSSGAPGGGAGGGVPVADGGTDGGSDAGGTPAADAGSGGDSGADAGEADAGGGADGGTTTASDCDGLTPPPPSTPSQFRLVNQDLDTGLCTPGETDGTGHIAVAWQDNYQPHQSEFTFVDPASAAAVGSHQGTSLVLIGQASGFMGGECAGADCFQDYVVLGPTGTQLAGSAVSGYSNNLQANDPTGGMIHARVSNPYGTPPVTVSLDAIDAAGAVRWTQALPESFGPGEAQNVVVGVDRMGNVLAMWSSSLGLYGAHAWAGQWFDHAGTRDPEFLAATGQSPGHVYPRVGSGLFIQLFTAGVASWMQIDALAISTAAPPAWLAARPDVALHMIHGGTGYAVLPQAGASAACEQQVEVVSPSGQVCGASTFAVGGASCTTGSIIVGYDGTVVQQLPREREAACTAAGHQCDCTYRYWPGYFR